MPCPVQLEEPDGVVTAQQGVYIVKVISVVTVIRSGCKYWVEIKSRNSQLFQVIQFFNDPIQIAAFESMPGGGRIPRFKWQVARRVAFTTCKADRKDLIENCGATLARWEVHLEPAWSQGWHR